jgi:hypothetical protein
MAEIRPPFISSWTVDTLKEYLDRRFEDQDKAVQAALQAAKEAVDKANTATSEKRFESINEFRGQLADQQTTFITRNEYLAQHQSLTEKVQALTDRINVSAGKSSGIGVSWGVVATILGLLLSAAFLGHAIG